MNDLQEYAIVIGNQHCGSRNHFDKKTWHRLLRLQWWEHDAAEIKACRFVCGIHGYVYDFLTVFETDRTKSLLTLQTVFVNVCKITCATHNKLLS